MTPHESYPESGESLLIIYDMRCPDGAQRFVEELAGWRGPLKTENIDRHHWALILHPGLAGKNTPPRRQDEDRSL